MLIFLFLYFWTRLQYVLKLGDVCNSNNKFKKIYLVLQLPKHIPVKLFSNMKLTFKLYFAVWQ